jgi:hypothetical protein
MAGKAQPNHASAVHGHNLSVVMADPYFGTGFNGLQLSENSLIVDQLAASIMTLPAQLSGSREYARGIDWKTFAGPERKGYANQ